ncbi:MAG: argininosuccinate lyase [Candidatus Dormibacteria bacterium]
MPRRTEGAPAAAPAHAWEGRLPGGTDPRLESFAASLPGDLEMYREDLAGSLAHARALERAGLLDRRSLAVLERGLKRVGRELDRGAFPFAPTDEDIHMAVERRLTELVGEPAQRLHTGRSRNDQVATDLRLWCRGATCELVTQAAALQLTLVRRARQHRATLLPGYTHLQRAQPVSLAHQLLAYFEMLDRDQERLRDLDHRTDASPLGAGALAGSTLRVDRLRPAQELGFTRLSRNSLDAVSDRDFAAELVFATALMGVHLSRLAEDLVIWNTKEFGFITLPDSWATGSSLMPQKKNPDVLELVRARSGRPLGALMGILTVLKALPLSYDRDLQEDRAHLFAAVGSVRQSLIVVTALLAELQFNSARMLLAAGDPQLLATDLAELLVERGVPFRLAHEMVGRLVRDAESRELGLDQVARESWQRLGLASLAEAEALFEPAGSLRRREQLGAPGPRRTAAAIAAAGERVAAHRRWAKALRRRLPA